MSGEELKSKTNIVMYWGIASAQDNQEYETSNEYMLLGLIVCQEKDVDDDYIATWYNLTMLLHNIGGKGGLKLVT